MIQMKPKNKFSTLALSTVAIFSTVAAHSGSDGATTGMMMDGAWMDSAGHMVGYNMWGMGWFGLIFGLAVWLLVILGIIYIYQQIMEQEGGKE